MWLRCPAHAHAGGRARMSDREPARSHDPGAIDPARAESSRTRVLSIARPAGQFVSAEEIRASIAIWGERAACSERELTRLKRDGTAVACALAELARATPVAGDAGPWDAEFRAQPPELVVRSGIPARRVERAVEVLRAARVIEMREVEGATLVRVRQEVWDDRPEVAALAWPSIRARLNGAGATVAPALAVLRELAWISSASSASPRRAGQGIACSLGDLARRTRFSETVVDGALRSLTAAGLLERDTSQGRTAVHRLTRAAYGEAMGEAMGDAEDGAPAPPAMLGRADARPATQPVVPARPDDPGPIGAPGAATGRAAGADVAPPMGITLELNGMPIPIGAGVPYRFEVDADGRVWCWIGRAFRLGPG